MPDDSLARLCQILIADDWFMRVLGAVRDEEPPDWAVGSGVIRTLVWDHLHGFTRRTQVRDVDVAFFDPVDLSRRRDRQIERELVRRLPAVPWEVTNQAGVHLWYEREFGVPIAPIRSIEDGVGRWPETATAVAVRLQPDGRLHVIAPCGLDDLLGIVLRRNTRQVTREHYRQRLREKHISERWPQAKIIDD